MNSDSQKPPRTRVLLVDDERSFTRMLKMQLERHYLYEVVAINKPSEALSILAEETFSVIVLDVIMPDMDGGDLSNRIRRLGIRTPIIFLTATVSAREASEGINSGGELFLAKPVKLDVLHRAITNAIASGENLRTAAGRVNTDQILRELTKEVLSDTSAAFLHKLTSLFTNISLMADHEAELLHRYAPSHTDLLQTHNEMAAALQDTLYLVRRFRNTLGQRHPGLLKEINISQVLANVCEHLRKVVPGHLELCEGAELCTDACRVKGDEELLWHLFENLVRNALEAIRDRANGLVMVTTEIGEERSVVRIRISDNGAGIPPEALTRIFDLNYSTKPKGLGIGLYLAHRAAVFHGGSIDCESTPNVGTEFTVTLPLITLQLSQ